MQNFRQHRADRGGIVNYVKTKNTTTKRMKKKIYHNEQTIPTFKLHQRQTCMEAPLGQWEGKRARNY